MKNYEEYMNKIKRFYTYIGNLIDLEEYNEMRELELLVKYIDDYNIDIDEIDINESDDDTPDDPVFNLSDNDNSQGSFEDLLKTNSYGIYQNKPPAYDSTKKLQHFMNSEIDTENILLYNKFKNVSDRCTDYLSNIYSY